MPAAGEYFPPGVEGGRGAVEHDEELLGEAEPADARGGVVGPGPRVLIFMFCSSPH